MKRLFVYAVAFSALAIGTATAADLPAKMYTKAPIMDPPYSWAGAYVGLNAGYSWGKQSNTLTDATGATVLGNSNSDSLKGFIGGGQLGYNWQFNQWVLGLEADFQGSAQKNDGTFLIPAVPAGFIPGVPATNFTYTDKLDWFGTVRGRLGLAQQGRWLPYVTGGWAYGHSALNGSSTGNIVSTFSGSKVYNGWTLGGGVEWAFDKKWSVKAEYLYIDFGNGPTIPVTAALNVSSGRMTDNIARLGVNYKF
jgi:outer membrane immunogenic protein